MAQDAYKLSSSDTRVGTRGLNVWGGVAVTNPIPREVQPKNGLAEDITGEGQINEASRPADPYMARFVAPQQQPG